MHGDAPSALGGIAAAIGTGEAQEAVTATLTAWSIGDARLEVDLVEALDLLRPMAIARTPACWRSTRWRSWIHHNPPAPPQEIPGMDRDTRRGPQTQREHASRRLDDSPVEKPVRRSGGILTALMTSTGLHRHRRRPPGRATAAAAGHVAELVDPRDSSSPTIGERSIVFGRKYGALDARPSVIVPPRRHPPHTETPHHCPPLLT